MTERIWFCKIGGELAVELADGVDLPMRQAVERAFKEITGVDAEFTFSGWCGQLDEYERAVVSPEPSLSQTPLADLKRGGPPTETDRLRRD